MSISALLHVQPVMTFTDIQRASTHAVPLAGSTTAVLVEIDRTYKVNSSFSILGQSYAFSTWSWAARGQAAFLALFHQHVARDPARYGAMVTKPDGTYEFLESMAGVATLPETRASQGRWGTSQGDEAYTSGRATHIFAFYINAARRRQALQCRRNVVTK